MLFSEWLMDEIEAARAAYERMKRNPDHDSVAIALLQVRLDTLRACQAAFTESL